MFDDRRFPAVYLLRPSLACASAVATIHTMGEEGIVENAAAIGRNVLETLAFMSSRSGIRSSVRYADSASSGRSTSSLIGPRASRLRRTAVRHPRWVPGWRRARNAGCCRSPTTTGCTRPAVHGHRRGGQGGPGDPRRGPRRSRRPLHRSDPQHFSGWRRGPARRSRPLSRGGGRPAGRRSRRATTTASRTPPGS